MFCQTCKRDSSPGVFCHFCFRYLPTSTVGVSAPIARRALAFLLDLVALVLLVAAAVWAGRFINMGTAQTHMLAVIAAASLLYLVAFLHGLHGGQTLGKLALGLKVVDRQTGQVPSLWRMFLRETLGKLLSGLALGMGYLTARDNIDGQAWHDRLADTVVTTPGDDPPPFPSAQHEQPLWPVAPLAALLLLVVSGLLAPRLHQTAEDAKPFTPEAPKPSASQLAATSDPHIQWQAAAPKPSAMDPVNTALPPTPASTANPAPLNPAPLDPAARLAAATPNPVQPLSPASTPRQASTAQVEPVVHPPVSRPGLSRPDLSRPAPSMPALAVKVQPPQPAPSPSQSLATPQYSRTYDPAQEIDHFLTNWSAAEADQGADQVGHFYAQDVQRYFLRRNVSRNYVVADHQAYLDRGRRALFFKVTNVRFERLSSDAASLDLVKSWDELSRDGTSATRRSTRSRLWLGKFPDGWKIVGEQDLKTP